MVEHVADEGPRSGTSRGREETPVRFVRDFVDLDMNWRSAALEITEHPSSWLGELLTQTRLGEGQVQARIDLKVAKVFGAPVVVTLAAPSLSRDSVLFPIAWSPASRSRLLPTFEGTLGVSKMEEDVSQLWIEGTYRAPLGRPGVLIDQALFHRFADSSIRGFLLRLARSLLASEKEK